MLKKVFLVSTFIFFYLILGGHLAIAQAGSKLGVNVTDHINEWDTAANAVGPGGWVVLMPQIGDCAAIQDFLTKHPDVNVVIRTHYPDNVPSEESADSWTATLGSLTHSQTLFIMPWNEPNFSRENGGIGNEANADSIEAVPMVQAYTSYFMNTLDEAGLLHRGVEMLSPMIGISAPNGPSFLNALGSGYLSSFYGVSLALYDFESCGGPLCNSNPYLNTGRYREALSNAGVGGAKLFAPEAGIVAPSGYCPSAVSDCPIFETGPMVSLTNAVKGTWSGDGNFIMGAYLSYNPEISDRSSWIWGQPFEQYLKSSPIGGSSLIPRSPIDQAKFDAWKAKRNLVDCDSCGKAVTTDFCRQSIRNPAISSRYCSNTDDQGIFRPHAYSVCKILPVPRTVSSYASSFEVIKKKSLDVGDILKSPECDGNFYPTLSWDATISESWDRPRLPVAGFGDSNLKNTNKIAGIRVYGADNLDLEAVSKYSADYLEGTAYYDQNGVRPVEYDPLASPPRIDNMKIGGVFRKLAPAWYQDKLKCQMIEKAKFNEFLNYPVKLKWGDSERHDLNTLFYWLRKEPDVFSVIRNGWDFFKDNILVVGDVADLLGLNSKNLKNFSCPPVDADARFLYRFTHPLEAHLWAAVPMFTREDTPGQVTISPQSPPGSLTDKTGDGVGVGSVTYPLSVPHLARLYEISKTTYSMLLPSALRSAVSASLPTSNQPLIASPPPDNYSSVLPRVTAENVSMNLRAPTNLLAADVCGHPFDIAIDNVKYEGNQLTYAVQFTNTSSEDGVQCHLYVNGMFWGGCIVPGGTRLDAGQSAGLVNPVPAGPNGTFTLSASGRLDQHKPCGVTADVGTSCSVTLKNGLVTATTCGPISTGLPACGVRTPFAKAPENTRAVQDPKDPDKLNNMRRSGTTQLLQNKDAVPLNGVSVDQVRQMWDSCYDPVLNTHHGCPSIEFTYSTGIRQSVLLPYLSDIWKNEAQEKSTGLFNLFTSGTKGKFPKVDSKSPIEFGASGENVTVNPGSGFVYFPFLQGVYEAQVCVSEKVLQPKPFAAQVTCPRF